MGRFSTLLSKDVKVVVRNRTLALTLVLYPLVMVSVLGLVFADPDQPIPVGIVVEPEGNADVTLSGARFSIDAITDTIDDVSTTVRYADRADAEEALRNGDVDAVIVFPEYFLADLLQDFRNRVSLDIVLDGSDPAKSAVAENLIRASIQRFNEQVVEYKVDVVVELLDLALDGDNGVTTADMSFREMLTVLRGIQENEDLSSGNARRLAEAIQFLEVAIVELEDSRATVTSIALPIQPDVQHVESGVLEARDIVVPAAVALSIFWTGILASATLVVYERQSNAQRRLNVTPVGMPTVIAAKLTVAGLIIMMQSLLIIGVAKLLWDIRIDNLFVVLLVLVAGSLAAVGLGLLVAGFSRDTNGSTLLSVLAVFPMMFLSGLFFPISFMPTAAQYLARIVPLTYAVDGLRGAMLRGFTLDNARVDLVVLVLIGAVSLVIGYLRNARLAREL